MKKIIILLFVASFFAACTKENDEVPEAAVNGTHTIAMQFEGSIDGFDSAITRATTTFANGTTMYIVFSNNSSEVKGTAVYNSSSKTWNLTYNGTLTNISNATCSVYYFTDPTSSTSERLYLNSSSAYYYGDIKYTKTSSSITITGTLQPNVSRVRFKGTSGKSIVVGGYETLIDFYKSGYSVYISSKDITLTVQSSGYTPYIYYTGCDNSISVTSEGTTYSLETTETMQNRYGKSGYLTIPTSSSHGGWTISDGSDTGSHAYVDLGLSVKWATCNVGASKPEEYGNYYAWGETSAYGEAPSAYPYSFTGTKNSGYANLSSKTNYDWSTYKYCRGSSSTMTKYCTSSSYGTVDNKTVLDLEDDAAHVNWGGSWRMPTKAEQDELRSNCTWTWTTQNGVKGYKVTSKTNGNSLFLPAAGFRNGSGLNGVGSSGNYWSSSLGSGSSLDAYCLYFYSGYVHSYNDYRRSGQSVRPVCP